MIVIMLYQLSILIKQDVGFYLHQEGPNLGKTSCASPRSALRATLAPAEPKGTRSAGPIGARGLAPRQRHLDLHRSIVVV